MQNFFRGLGRNLPAIGSALLIIAGFVEWGGIGRHVQRGQRNKAARKTRSAKRGGRKRR